MDQFWTYVISGCVVAVVTASIGFFFWLLQRRLTDPINQLTAVVGKLEKATIKLFEKFDDEVEKREGMADRLTKIETEHKWLVCQRSDKKEFQAPKVLNG